jgi:kynurenine formamidase
MDLEALPAEVRALADQVSNWGRWGADDELGTLNLIDAAAVRRGAAAVRSGTRFGLALPLHSEGIQMGYIRGRVNPLRTMVMLNGTPLGEKSELRANDDMVVMGLQAATHWDGLAHVSFAGQLYNGYPASSVTADEGATRCGIEKVESVVTRGILLDVARGKGLNKLEPGYGVTSEDLDAALALTGVAVEPGDIVLVRTGQMTLLRQDRPDKIGYAWPSPGLTVSTVSWFRARDVAAVAIDNMTFEVYPPENERIMLPVHFLHLVMMGLTQGQNWMLEDLAANCAADGVYEFLLSAPPEPFVGGVGSPVNPVAVK